MIKKLFFTAALLAPALAYAGTPSATLPGQIVPASDPAVPAPALAAGFTTPVLNADFTQIGGFYANTANFINECGATSAWRFYLHWASPGFAGYDRGPAPCNRALITTDGGIQVLHLQYTAADEQNYSDLMLWWPKLYLDVSSPMLPIAGYFELRFRLSPASLTQSQPLNVLDFWSSVQDNAPAQSAGWIETDFFETYSNTITGHVQDTVMSFHDWTQDTGTAGLWWDTAQIDQTSYHTLGFLVTGDGTGNFSMCVYQDGVPMSNFWQTRGTRIGSCSQGVATGGDGKLTQHYNYVNLLIGANGTNVPNTLITNTIDLYIQKIDIWMCANYVSGQCVTALVTN